MVLIWVAAALVLVLAMYVVLSAILYRKLVVPDRRSWMDDFQFTPYEFQADYEDVDLVTADGIAFNAWFFRQPGTPQVVVVSPGHKGRRQDLLGISVALWRKGFNVVAYSYRGMAGSDSGLITMGVHEVQELEAAIAFARGRVRNARIGLLGYSMGGAVSLLGAAGDPGVAALVLDSPFADARQVVRENVWQIARVPGAPFVFGVALWLRLWHGVRLADACPRAVMSGLEGRPLFFIHGGADVVCSVRHSRELYDAYKGPREIWVVQGAPHVGAYFADRPLYVERVAGFFGRTLGLKSGHLRLVTEDEEEVS